jgi:hypothetical protein
MGVAGEHEGTKRPSLAYFKINRIIIFLPLCQRWDFVPFMAITFKQLRKDAASILGKARTEKKAAAARLNGRKPKVNFKSKGAQSA